MLITDGRTHRLMCKRMLYSLPRDILHNDDDDEWEIYSNQTILRPNQDACITTECTVMRKEMHVNIPISHHKV